MKKVAIISRALQMNGATKALVEMLKRIDYSMIDRFMGIRFLRIS